MVTFCAREERERERETSEIEKRLGVRVSQANAGPWARAPSEAPTVLPLTQETDKQARHSKKKRIDKHYLG